METVRERKIRVIDDDRIEVEIYDAARDPSPVSDTDSPAFRLVDRTLRDVVPGDGLVVAPYLVFGGTDATHYGDRSRSVCRLLPVRVEAGDLGRVHGTDERISVEGFGMAVRYFHRLLRNLEEL
ncbi:MAG: M20/M25/M40 family metallo-hydrolase [Gemmatimonadetes bacterium]|nr:M20/M25/M40 family metallo-hydrolase [Gemmatimonadota bacterium]NIR79987.1 M20/M25/M40 family metallo-hydrolase [Gemmatimonadota bacterium]NIT88718.1 M20/M25/M40 family metallo-hydrolase [Gemmatimonadota bacterium]NIU32525.1 M20/M25/M40 family metallo-hydrolase [Gemmatimonadota bacterium]NIU36995.1 M20/M25/M40 family metallo-hydrolase [Gemmatimonadota bacterium]